ncbi:MAG: hypothetical protein AAB382_05950 [Chloroflexota bacterium]
MPQARWANRLRGAIRAGVAAALVVANEVNAVAQAGAAGRVGRGVGTPESTAELANLITSAVMLSAPPRVLASSTNRRAVCSGDMNGRRAAPLRKR